MTKSCKGGKTRRRGGNRKRRGGGLKSRRGGRKSYRGGSRKRRGGIKRKSTLYGGKRRGGSRKRRGGSRKRRGGSTTHYTSAKMAATAKALHLPHEGLSKTQIRNITAKKPPGLIPKGYVPNFPSIYGK